MTAHGDEVGIDTRSAAIVSLKPPKPEGVLGALAHIPSTRSDLLILTVDTDDAVDFHLHPHSQSKSPILILRMINRLPFALMHPFSGMFVTAVPLGGHPLAPLHNTAAQINAWEWFNRGVEETRDDGPARRMTMVEQFLHKGLTADDILSGLAVAPNGTLINALLPILPTRLLDDLGRKAVTDGSVLGLLASAFPKDPWACGALPALAKWRVESGADEERVVAKLADETRKRRRIFPWWPRSASTSEQVGEQRRPATRPSQINIGPELDILGSAGLVGNFISLPHACNARARRSIRPRKKVAIVATARNEGIYLLQWVAYHRLLGIDDFYIYSNDNEDGSDDLLRLLAQSGLITWIDSKLDVSGGNAQFKAYGHALSYFPDTLDYEWILIIDLDEFLILDQAVYPTMADFCDWHNDRGADTVAINWLFLGSSEEPHTIEIPLIERNRRLLTRAEMGDGIRLVKSMSRPNRICHSEAHVPFADERSGLVSYHASGRPHRWHDQVPGMAHSPKFSDVLITDTAVIHHYIFKSADEWLWKNARNPGDHRLTEFGKIEPMTTIRAKNFLAQHEVSHLDMTDRAAGMTRLVQDEIDKLAKIGDIGAAHRRICSLYHDRLAQIKEVYRGSAAVRSWDPEAQRFLYICGIPGWRDGA